MIKVKSKTEVILKNEEKKEVHFATLMDKSAELEPKCQKY